MEGERVRAALTVTLTAALLVAQAPPTAAAAPLPPPRTFVDDPSLHSTQILKFNPTVNPAGTCTDWYASGYAANSVDAPQSGGYNKTPLKELRTKSLAAFANRTVQIRFSFNTGDALFNKFEGWYVDNVKVTDPALGTIFIDNVESGTNGWTTTSGGSGGNGTTAPGWHITTKRSTEFLTHAWWYGNEATGTFEGVPDTSLEDSCSDAGNFGTLTSPAMILGANSTLEFDTLWQIEAVNADGFDIMTVVVVEDLVSVKAEVRLDLNGNGALDSGEPPLKASQLQLRRIDGEGETVVATAVNSENITVTGIAPGSFKLVETDASGFVSTNAIAGSFATKVDNNTITTTLAGGQTSLGNVFLDRFLGLAGIARCSAEGTPLANATVQLIQAGVVLATATSDASGVFLFPGVGAGTFTLKFIVTEEEFESTCTVQVTLGANGIPTFGQPQECQPSNTWLTADPLTANGTAALGVICSGRRWYQIVMPAGGTVVPPLSRIVARLTGVGGGRLPGDFTLMLVKDPLLALQPVTNATDAHVQFAGDTFGGDTFGGDTFGGDTFGGDTFGGDTFGGDTFGGDTFGGDTFGGDTFGGDTFGGDTFGGDTFGGDTFGGDTFGGDTFGGDTFGGDTFGGDTFGGSFLSLAGGDPRAYSVAIARSVVRVSARRGTSAEGLWQNTWANSITWYLRVSSYRGAEGAFNISAQVFTGLCNNVDPAAAGTLPAVPGTGLYDTLILRHGGREGPGADAGANILALQALAAHLTVNGYVADFAGHLAAAYAQYDANPSCPAAANTVAEGVRGYIHAFKNAHPQLKWILIAASDEGIPLVRVPDYASLGPQSMLRSGLPLRPLALDGELRLNFFGTDDAYGDWDPVRKTDHFLYLPELGVGRISEPKYVPGMVTAYTTANGLLTPQTAGVYGYNFWNDSANSIKSQLEATGKSVNQFPTAHPKIQSGQGLPTDPDAWNAQDLIDGFAANTDLLVLMAHGLRASEIAPANYFPTVKPQQLIQVANTTPAIKRLKLLISGACNFALNVPGQQAIPNVTPDPETSEIGQALNWTTVGWAAYAYGDDERADKYSEGLADALIREFRYGASGAVVLGDAFVRVKRDYAAGLTNFSGIDQKTLMGMVILGFPMLRVDLGTQGRLGARPSGLADFGSTSLFDVPDLPGSNPALDLRTKDITIDFTELAHQLDREDVVLTNVGADGNPTAGTTTASYYRVTTPTNPLGFVQSVPFEPMTPSWSVPLHPNDLPDDSPMFARGAALWSATCKLDQNFTPLVTVPGYQLAPERGPYFADRFVPNDWWEINYLDSRREFLLMRLAQYRSATSLTGQPEIFGTERRFEQVHFRVYYSSLLAQPITAANQQMQAIHAGPPEFLSHSATPLPGGTAIQFDAFMSGLPNLGIQTVIVTWQDSPGACALNSFALTPDANRQHWSGTLTGVIAANVRYMLQAVNGAGRVRVADNFGLFYPAETPPTAQAPLADTDIDFVAPPTPTSAVSGRTITAVARLKRTDTNANLAGKRLLFRLSGVNGDRAFGYTNADGVATAQLTVDVLPGSLFVHVEFEGDDDFNGSSERSALTVAKETTSFASLSAQPATQQQGATILATARLLDGLQRRLREQGVLFLITGPVCVTYEMGASGCTVLQAHAAETDFRGDAKASIALNQPVGTYRLHAAFAGKVQVPSGNPAPLTLDLENARYEPARASLGVTVTNQRIAFTSSRTGNGDIYVMNTDGNGVLRLTTHSAIDADPDWSPDRTKIAFTSSRTGFGDIYVMNADGSGQTRLTTSSAIDTFGSWSPDGTKMAFTSTRHGNLEIYVMNADGSGVTRLTNHSAIDADPYWSGDGTKIAFTSFRTGNGDIYVMNANGTGTPVRLTNHSAIDTLGSWSPDGTKIVFTSTREGNSEIYVMNADGTGVTRLTTHPKIDAAPDWSPDGTKIVFASTRDGNSEIYVMNPDGTGQARLTNHSRLDTLPSW